GGGLGATELALEERIEGPLDIFRSQRTAIMKSDAVAQVKHVGFWIGNFPAFCQPGLDIQVLVAIEQIVEDELVDAFRKCINPHARVEIRGAALDDHDQSLGRTAASARSQVQG